MESRLDQSFAQFREDLSSFRSDLKRSLLIKRAWIIATAAVVSAVTSALIKIGS